ncbi:LysR family transcriptional regulator [Actinomadura decatromicini]|uniref:LysR family transcriptional regulator n=1 Tax=Actinomadura decatromicini TaxID=2604572 RepID=A0A5D3FAR3_9ACTN|nr:LysR family transcriptional regulator [Actinomadura decatromicini]TYK44994.1 LysR family transcriptional regulator [Actinomadura decatromicini]
MLERHEIEALVVLAEELHFGRTAERLGVSTSRVSQTVRGLERRVGVRLFDRTSRRVALTPAGRRLAAEVGPAWALIGAAVDRAVREGRGVTGTLRAAFTGAAGGQLLAGAARLARSREPGLRVVLREARPGEVAAWLRDGEAEVCLVEFPADADGAEVEVGPVLVREARMLAVPAGHPFARRGSVPVGELARVRVLDPPSRRGGTLQEALTLVGAGEGVLPVGAHVRRYHARPDVAYVPLDGAPPVEWGLVWRAGGDSARVRAFVRAARDLLDVP